MIHTKGDMNDPTHICSFENLKKRDISKSANPTKLPIETDVRFSGCPVKLMC